MQHSEIRVLKSTDASAVATLFQKIGWDQSVSYISNFIKWGHLGSFGLFIDNQVVATAITITYANDLAWVGMVTCDPDYQRRGFARRMMETTMHYVEQQGIRTTMLDASDLGYGLYESMGFQPLYKINIWVGAPVFQEPSQWIRRMTRNDLPSVTKIDAQICGLNRQRVMEWAYEDGHAWVYEQDGLITGYLFSRGSGNPSRIGAWFGYSPTAANALLAACGNQAIESNRKMRISAPEPNEAAAEIAQRAGLRLDRHVTRMVYGAPAPGNMEQQYSVASFSTG
ncbi:MAG: GNAT family N-acetyltransferase [Anaerolineae bacterium]|nr:GNAT family N-acetyltransferase [Anaerolineae bacterium]